MHRKNHIKNVGACAFLTLLLALPGCDGVVRVDGVVNDEHGKGIPGAVVTLTPTEDCEFDDSFVARTDSMETFSVLHAVAPSAPCDSLLLRVEKDGYRNYEKVMPYNREGVSYFVVVLHRVE